MPLNFTPEQLSIFEFVRNGKSHGIIDAVAGAGKTTTIMECARFVENHNDILFCAFNKSISSEISKKFSERNINGVIVKTIHALGWQILHSNNNTGYPLTLEPGKNRELLNSKEISEKLKPYYLKILAVNGIKLDFLDDKPDFAVTNIINNVKNRLLDINDKYRSTLTKDTLDDFRELVSHYGIFNELEIKKKDFEKELAYYQQCHSILLEAGNEFSKRTMKIDFTDMLYLPYKWSLYPVNKYGFLFIDECQDLSKAQFAIAAKYGRPGGRILAVGDPQQSIYGFTGADINSFNRVKEYTKATLLPLTTCFRCPQQMIGLAKKIRPDITGSKTDAGIITTIEITDVVKTARPGDLIISRTKAPLLVLVFGFIDVDLKVKIHDDEVEEIINELKNIFKHNELNVDISTLPDKFDEVRAVVLNRWDWIIKKNANRIVNMGERELYIRKEKEYLEEKLDFLNRKYEEWKIECPTILSILRKIKEYISATDNPIKLSTIHRAKGLENDRVFIINYDELPMIKTDQKEWEKIQESNLKYVAVTRAMKELVLVKPKKIDVLIMEGSLFDDLPFGN